MTTRVRQRCLGAVYGAAAILMVGCGGMKTPATADVAVSRAAVETAAGAGAAELAPAEMASARDKLLRASQALTARDYRLARDLADQAQADADLARSKANSAKARVAADTLNDDIRVMRDELNRATQSGQ